MNIDESVYQSIIDMVTEVAEAQGIVHPLSRVAFLDTVIVRLTTDLFDPAHRDLEEHYKYLDV